MADTIGLFQSQKKSKVKPTVPIKVGNQLQYGALKSEYLVQLETGQIKKVHVDTEKQTVTIGLNVYPYEKIWVIPGQYSFILLYDDLTYTLIGQYHYSFELPYYHDLEIIDFSYDDRGLYAVSTTHTYLLMDRPLWISNLRRTSFNPYQQWSELSEKKRKETIIFQPLFFEKTTVF